jgi:hypothetical protein
MKDSEICKFEQSDFLSQKFCKQSLILSNDVEDPSKVWLLEEEKTVSQKAQKK